MNDTPAGPGLIHKLRPSVVFAPYQNGIFFKCFETSFVFKGHAALYSLFERILPFLTEGVELEALLSAVPGNARPVVSSLLSQLRDQELMIEVQPEALASLSVEERETFREMIAFLEGMTSRPYEAFLRLRRAEVVVIGTGWTLFSAIRSLCRAGVGRLEVWIRGGDRARIDRLLAAHPLVRTRLRSTAEGELELESANLVLELFEDGEDPRGSLIPSNSAIPRLRAVSRPEFGIVGPLFPASESELTDACARLRRPSAVPDVTPLRTPILEGTVANIAAFEAARFLCALPSKTQLGQAAVVLREPFSTRYHPVLRVVEAPASDEAELRRLLELSAAQTATEIPETSALTDERFGLVLVPHPDELPQLPLFTASALVRDPDAPVLGHGRTLSAAYARAVVAGVRALASRDASESIAMISREFGGTRAFAIEQTHLAVGIGFDDWLADAARGLLLGIFSGRIHSDLKFSVQPIADAGAAAHRTSKLIRLLFGRRVELQHFAVDAVPGFHLAAISSDGEWLSSAGGFDFAATVDEALSAAAARLQWKNAGLRLPDPPAQPSVELASAEHDLARSTTPAGVFDALRALGRHLWVRPWDREPGILKCGFVAGWVGLDGD